MQTLDILPRLILLNALRTNGYLQDLSNVQGGRWRSTLTESIVIDTTDRHVLGQVLQLIPTLAPNQLDLSWLNLRQTREEWMAAGEWNDAHVVAAVLRCVNEIGLKELPFADLVDTWSWNREVMEQLAIFSEMTET